MLFSIGLGYRCSGKERHEPRLSAAIIIPSLYLIANTLDPVTMGCLAQAECVKFSGRANEKGMLTAYAELRRLRAPVFE